VPKSQKKIFFRAKLYKYNILIFSSFCFNLKNSLLTMWHISLTRERKNCCFCICFFKRFSSFTREFSSSFFCPRKLTFLYTFIFHSHLSLFLSLKVNTVKTLSFWDPYSILWCGKSELYNMIIIGSLLTPFKVSVFFILFGRLPHLTKPHGQVMLVRIPTFWRK